MAKLTVDKDRKKNIQYLWKKILKEIMDAKTWPTSVNRLFWTFWNFMFFARAKTLDATLFLDSANPSKQLQLLQIRKLYANVEGTA